MTSERLVWTTTRPLWIERPVQKYPSSTTNKPSCDFNSPRGGGFVRPGGSLLKSCRSLQAFLGTPSVTRNSTSLHAPIRQSSKTTRLRHRRNPRRRDVLSLKRDFTRAACIAAGRRSGLVAALSDQGGPAQGARLVSARACTVASRDLRGPAAEPDRRAGRFSAKCLPGLLLLQMRG